MDTSGSERPKIYAEDRPEFELWFEDEGEYDEVVLLLKARKFQHRPKSPNWRVPLIGLVTSLMAGAILMGLSMCAG